MDGVVGPDASVQRVHSYVQDASCKDDGDCARNLTECKAPVSVPAALFGRIAKTRRVGSFFVGRVPSSLISCFQQINVRDVSTSSILLFTCGALIVICLVPSLLVFTLYVMRRHAISRERGRDGAETAAT